MGNSTKIDWCDSTWNPVTGCLHGCEYCYARRIAERFSGAYEFVCEEKRDQDGHVVIDKEGMPVFDKCGVYKTEPNGWLHILEKRCTEQDTLTVGTVEENEGRAAKVYPYPFGFDPTFHKYRLNEPQGWKKARTVFVCSMADLFGEWVPEEWIKAVFDACEKAPQHRYIFLTKNPSRLMLMAAAKQVEDGKKYRPEDMEKIKGHTPIPKHDNWWFGSTLDNKNSKRFQSWGYHSFTSIEPLTEYMNMGIGSFGSDEWVIIGAETGSRKGKVIPKREWVDNIVEAASITHMKIFMKESLRSLMGDDFIQEFPW